MAIHPKTGQLWTSEHGPRGGDEINEIEKGKNYGFPVIGYGRDYTGKPINGDKTAQAGMEQPVYFWTPDIAPAGIAFYTGHDVSGVGRQSVRRRRSPARISCASSSTATASSAEERLLTDLNARIRGVNRGTRRRALRADGRRERPDPQAR